MVLQDAFGRKFPYLRLSVTEVCNFRCTYCLPEGYQKSTRDFLSQDELVRLVRGFSSLGVHKVRLTGGEPTTRTDLAAIAHSIAAIPGIQTVALTTNGLDLAKNAYRYFDAGVRSLNVSVDSLNSKHFHEITGHDKLDQVLEGISVAKKAGFKPIKINTVLLREVTDSTLPDFLEWIKREDFSVRFIELMQTGDNKEFFLRHHLRANLLIEQLLDRGFAPIARNASSGPAQEFAHLEYAGKIGVIAPYSHDFCKSCNRLRVTARGQLMLCLFGEGGIDLRPFLQRDEQQDALVDTITTALHFKRDGHALHQGITGSTHYLAAIGG